MPTRSSLEEISWSPPVSPASSEPFSPSPAVVQHIDSLKFEGDLSTRERNLTDVSAGTVDFDADDDNFQDSEDFDDDFEHSDEEMDDKFSHSEPSEGDSQDDDDDNSEDVDLDLFQLNSVRRYPFGKYLLEQFQSQMYDFNMAESEKDAGLALFYHTMTGFALGALGTVSVIGFCLAIRHFSTTILTLSCYLFLVTALNFIDVSLKAQLNSQEWLGKVTRFPVNNWRYQLYSHSLALVEFTIWLWLWPASRAALRVLAFIFAIAILYIHYLALNDIGLSFSSSLKCSSSSFLVTTGVYRFSRHPLYATTFWFNVALQVMLMNPITGFLIVLSNWLFVSRIIQEEENDLKLHFQTKYEQYRMRTPVLIPGL